MTFRSLASAYEGTPNRVKELSNRAKICYAISAAIRRSHRLARFIRLFSGMTSAIIDSCVVKKEHRKRQIVVFQNTGVFEVSSAAQAAARV